MGFLMSDTMLLDTRPLDTMHGTTTWMLEGLTDWVYAADPARDLPEYEIEDPTE